VPRWLGGFSAFQHFDVWRQPSAFCFPNFCFASAPVTGQSVCKFLQVLNFFVEFPPVLLDSHRTAFKADSLTDKKASYPFGWVMPKQRGPGSLKPGP
jgi:hypothetical protein